MIGKVQTINKDRAFGFIQSEEYPKGVFFHLKNYSGAFDELEKGDVVNFDPKETPKGMAAENVSLA